MMSFVWFCLVSYGLTQILVYSSILRNIRPTEGFWGELFGCPMCMGFWVGVFLWLISGQTELFTFDSSLLTGLSLGFASSGSSYVLNMVFGDSGIKIQNIIS